MEFSRSRVSDNEAVTTKTQKATNIAGLMIMVDMKRSRPSRTTAHSAYTTLDRQDLIVLLLRDTVCPLKVSVACVNGHCLTL